MENIRYYTDGEQATAEVLNRPLEDLEKVGQYISKNEYDKMTQIKRDNSAGSGIIEFPKIDTETFEEINGEMYTFQHSDINHDGYTYEARRNSLIISRDDHDIKPKINFGGDEVTLTRNFSSNVNNSYIFAKVPEAVMPSIENDSSSLSKDYDYTDQILLNDTNRNLSYMIDLYSLFNERTGTTVNNGDGSYTYNAGSQSNGDWYFLHPGKNTLINGVEYDVSFNIGDYNGPFSIGGLLNRKQEGSIVSGKLIGGNRNNGTTGLYIISTDTDTDIIISDISIKMSKTTVLGIKKQVLSGTDIYPSTDSFAVLSAVSRQDLVFAESWHELINEKDIVYPYGNIQYKGSNTDGLSGITEGTFSGAETYSLFGNWQEDSALIGRGYVWSTLSQEDRLKFSSNKDNNVYMSKDGLVQVRYRIRTIKGLSNSNLNLSGETWNRQAGASALNWFGSKTYIKFRGKSISKQDVQSGDNGTLVYTGTNNKGKEKGLFQGYNQENTISGTYVSMFPIATIQRRNKGAFHPEFNYEGSSTFSDGKKWDTTSASCNNIIDCFTNSTNGDADSEVSGRIDDFYYDEINARDVEDVRMYSEKISNMSKFLDDKQTDLYYNKIRSSEGIMKLIEINEGTPSCRGASYTNVEYPGNGYYGDSTRLFMSNPPLRGYIPNVSLYNYRLTIQGKSGIIYGIDRIENNGSGTIYYLHSHYGDVRDDFDDYDTVATPEKNIMRLYGTSSDYTQSDKTLFCDIVGDLNSYPSNFLEKGFIGSPLTVDKDGNDLTSTEAMTTTDGIYTKATILPLSRQTEGEGYIIATNKSTGDKSYAKLHYEPWSGASGNFVNQCSTSGNANYVGDGNFVAAIENKKASLYITKNDTWNADDYILQIFYETTPKNGSFSNNSVLVYSNNKGRVSSLYSGSLMDNLLAKPYKYTNTLNSIYKDFRVEFSTRKCYSSELSDAGALKEDKIIQPEESWAFRPSHETLDLAIHMDKGPSIKFFTYLSKIRSKASINLVFKEMKWDDGNDIDNIVEYTAGTTVDTMIKGTPIKFSGFTNEDFNGRVFTFKNDLTTIAEDQFDGYIINADGKVLTTSASYSGYQLYDGNGWGDDNKFIIHRNSKVSTTRDDNNKTVLYGQKAITLPYFLD